MISTTDANSNTTTTKYRRFGEVIDQTDATGQVTSYRYDFDGRQTRVAVGLSDDQEPFSSSPSPTYSGGWSGLRCRRAIRAPRPGRSAA